MDQGTKNVRHASRCLFVACGLCFVLVTRTAILESLNLLGPFQKPNVIMGYFISFCLLVLANGLRRFSPWTRPISILTGLIAALCLMLIVIVLYSHWIGELVYSPWGSFNTEAMQLLNDIAKLFVCALWAYAGVIMMIGKCVSSKFPPLDPWAVRKLNDSGVAQSDASMKTASKE